MTLWLTPPSSLWYSVTLSVTPKSVTFDLNGPLITTHTFMHIIFDSNNACEFQSRLPIRRFNRDCLGTKCKLTSQWKQREKSQTLSCYSWLIQKYLSYPDEIERKAISSRSTLMLIMPFDSSQHNVETVMKIDSGYTKFTHKHTNIHRDTQKTYTDTHKQSRVHRDTQIHKQHTQTSINVHSNMNK